MTEQLKLITKLMLKAAEVGDIDNFFKYVKELRDLKILLDQQENNQQNLAVSDR